MEHVHHYDFTSKQRLSTVFVFWLNKKSNACRKCSFSRTNVDMITEWYNTGAIVWRTQLLCVCRLVTGEQTDIVSNSYATNYSVKLSLRKTLRDLWLHLVNFTQWITLESVYKQQAKNTQSANKLKGKKSKRDVLTWILYVFRQWSN